MRKIVKKVINMKRITIALSIILSVFFLYSFVADAQELLNEDMEVETDYGVQETDYAIALTGKQVEAELTYLTEVYVNRFPELGLESVYGSPSDKKDLKDLQESITGDMAPGKESAEMIIKWVLNNITYDKFSGVYIAVPADVVTHGVASCYGIANLCQALMRDAGIPTVVAVGVRWDMEGVVTIADINNDTYSDHNHAWIYAYIDGEWKMYDPLFGVMGTTDKDFISKWYFHEGTEGIIPYYDGLLTLSDIKESSRYIYKDGKFWNYHLGEAYGDNGGIMLDNNGIVFRGKSCQIRDDGFFPSYVYGNDCELENGELYSGGWVLGTADKDKPIEDQEPVMYLYDNGMGAVKTIKYFCGKPYYVDHNGWLLPISEDMAETCHLDRGYLTVPVGGEFKWEWNWKSSWYDIWKSGNYENVFEDYSYSFSSEFDNVEISNDGVIKGLKPGGVNVYCTERVDWGNGQIGYNSNLICITVVGDLEESGVTIEDIPDQEYTGKEITPDVIVKNGDETLYNYLDYRVFYENNIDAGTATVTIKGLSDYSGTITKTFNILPPEDIPITGIEMETKSLNMDEEDTAVLNVKVLPMNSYYQNVDWSSSDPDIATVSAEGIVSALKEGHITITASTKDGKYKDYCEVWVNKKRINLSVPANLSWTGENNTIAIWDPVEDVDVYLVEIETRHADNTIVTKRAGFSNNNHMDLHAILNDMYEEDSSISTIDTVGFRVKAESFDEQVKRSSRWSELSSDTTYRWRDGKITLATPTVLAWAANCKATAIWNSVKDAEYYSVQLKLRIAKTGETTDTVINVPDESGMLSHLEKNRVDLQTAIDQSVAQYSNEDYIVKSVVFSVKAHNSDVDKYISSAESVDSEDCGYYGIQGVKSLETPKNLSWSGKYSTIAKWDAVDHAGFYSYKISIETGSTIACILESDGKIQNTSVDLTYIVDGAIRRILDPDTITGVKFQVQACSDDTSTYKSSHWSEYSADSGYRGGAEVNPNDPTPIPASVDEIAVVSQKIDTKSIFRVSSYKKYAVTPNENATITNKGILSPKKAGTITVTGFNKVGGQWVPDTDNVISIEIEKPEFYEKTVTLNYPGAVMTASENLNEMFSTPSKWLISNNKIATIDPDTGVITAVKAGTVKVTAQFGEQKGQIAKYSFTVKVVFPAISKKSATMLTGATLNLKLNKAVGTPEWSSEDATIAEVNENGQVIAHNAGETIITAALDGIEYNCKIKVKKPTLSSKKLTLKEGKTKKLVLKNSKLTTTEWISSDESVATVDESGIITAVSKGVAEISTTTGGCTDVCVVTVK